MFVAFRHSSLPREVRRRGEKTALQHSSIPTRLDPYQHSNIEIINTPISRHTSPSPPQLSSAHLVAYVDPSPYTLSSSFISAQPRYVQNNTTASGHHNAHGSLPVISLAIPFSLLARALRLQLFSKIVAFHVCPETRRREVLDKRRRQRSENARRRARRPV